MVISNPWSAAAGPAGVDTLPMEGSSDNTNIVLRVNSPPASRFDVLGSVGAEIQEAYVSLIGELYLACNQGKDSLDSKKTAEIYIKSRKFLDNILTAAFYAANKAGATESLGSKLKILRSSAVSCEQKKIVQTGIAHMQVLNQLGKMAKLTEMAVSSSNAAGICLGALEPITSSLSGIVNSLQSLPNSAGMTNLEYESDDSDCSSCTTHSSSNEEPHALLSSATWSMNGTSSLSNVALSPTHNTSWSPMISPSPLSFVSEPPMSSPSSSSIATTPATTMRRGSINAGELPVGASPPFLPADSIITPTYSPLEAINTPPYVPTVESPKVSAMESPKRKYSSPVSRPPPGLPIPEHSVLKGVIGETFNRRASNAEPFDGSLFDQITREMSSMATEDSMDSRKLKFAAATHSSILSSKPHIMNRRHSTPVLVEASAFRSPSFMSPPSPRGRGGSVSRGGDDGDNSNKKGQLCKYGLVNQCKYDACWRAHSIEEVVKYNEFFRTHKCHKGDGSCKNGAACSYYHSEEQKMEADCFRLKYHGWTTANPPAHLLASPKKDMLGQSNNRSAGIQRRQSTIAYMSTPTMPAPGSPLR